MKPLKCSTHQDYPPRSRSGDPHSTENLSIHPMNLEVLLLGAKHSKETTTNGCALTSRTENQRKLVSLTCYVVRSHLRTTWCTLAPACVSKGNLMLSCASFFTTSWRICNWLRTITGKFIWTSGTWLPDVTCNLDGLSWFIMVYHHVPNQKCHFGGPILWQSHIHKSSLDDASGKVPSKRAAIAKKARNANDA